MKKQLLLLTTLFVSMIGYSQTFTNNFIDYQIVSNSYAETVGYNVAGGTVVNIPSTIVEPISGTTYNVTSIGLGSFLLKGLTNISIPNGVTSVGDAAFIGNNLTNVIIPNTVINIGPSAFQNNLLTQITIPSNVTIIGNQAFIGNPLTSVTTLATIPPTVNTGGSNDTFNSNRSTIHLHIPAGTMGVYVTNAGALWTGFNPVTQDALNTSNFELDNDIRVITDANSIKIISSNNSRLQNYILYNISGAKVASGNENEINTENFASGVYILKLQFDKGMLSEKVIIN